MTRKEELELIYKDESYQIVGACRFITNVSIYEILRIFSCV